LRSFEYCASAEGHDRAGGHAGHRSCKTFANHAVSFQSIIFKVLKNSKLANLGEV
jgi:hypothetical protein